MKSFSVDKYLTRVFNISSYNCWDLVREVWLDLTGDDIGKRTPIPPTIRSMKEKFTTEESYFLKIEKPVSPCIVLMKRNKMLPHVGIFVKNKVLHIKESGVEYQNLSVASIGFKEVGFYTCRK